MNAITTYSTACTKNAKTRFRSRTQFFIQISLLMCQVVSCGVVVIAIASEGRDTVLESHMNFHPRDREILCMHSQSATWKNKKIKSPKMESNPVLCSSNKVNNFQTNYEKSLQQLVMLLAGYKKVKWRTLNVLLL